MRHHFSRILFLGFITAASLSAASARASVLYDESVSGDLSNNQAAPTPLTLALGANSILGTVGAADSQDWLLLTVPTGEQLTSLILATYVSTDTQGFTGVQKTTTGAFVGSTNSPGSYLGYTHFGTGATNTGLPVTNLVNTDILPLMGNTSAAPGSTGFVPPLSTGTYAFLIQQLGASTQYQFNFNVATPEPTSLGLLACAAACTILARRRPQPRT